MACETCTTLVADHAAERDLDRRNEIEIMYADHIQKMVQSVFLFRFL